MFGIISNISLPLFLPYCHQAIRYLSSDITPLEFRSKVSFNSPFMILSPECQSHILWNFPFSSWELIIMQRSSAILGALFCKWRPFCNSYLHLIKSAFCCFCFASFLHRKKFSRLAEHPQRHYFVCFLAEVWKNIFV